ncbi:50S ribosomal protein L25 [Patescibacteria group bacterium]
MGTINLIAQPRDSKNKPKTIRKEGFVPAIIYGDKIKSQSLKVSQHDFIKAYRKAGVSNFIDLIIDKNNSIKVLVQEVQKDPITDDYLHVDFYQIRMDKEITTEVPLKFTGQSKAVKDEEGILVKNITELKITCLPKDLPASIEVDISPLENFEDNILIKDLKIGKELQVDAEPDEVVVTVDAPRSEEEIEALEEEAEADVDEVEVTSEKKEEEGEEGEEGEEAKEGEEGEVKEGEEKKPEEGKEKEVKKGEQKAETPKPKKDEKK